MALKRAVQYFELYFKAETTKLFGSYKLHSQNLFLDIVVALKRAVSLLQEALLLLAVFRPLLPFTVTVVFAWPFTGALLLLTSRLSFLRLAYGSEELILPF